MILRCNYIGFFITQERKVSNARKEIYLIFYFLIQYSCSEELEILT